MYGQLGTNVGVIPCIGMAETVTYLGRRSIMNTRDFIISNRDSGDPLYKDIIIRYGDTDSVYCQFNGATIPEAHVRADKIAHLASEHLNSTEQLIDRTIMDLEYEALYCSMVRCSASLFGGGGVWFILTSIVPFPTGELLQEEVCCHRSQGDWRLV